MKTFLLEKSLKRLSFMSRVTVHFTELWNVGLELIATLSVMCKVEPNGS